MSDVVISVRGEASTVVDPDFAQLACAVRVTTGDKVSAMASAANALRTVEADLARLGGVVETSESQRAPLSWVASSVSSREEIYWDRHTEQKRPSGQFVAAVSLRLRVRELSLLPDVGAALDRHTHLEMDFVSWHVDGDNPAWPRVRADAIKAALQRARDYADALGGTVSNVEQIADSGLLSRHGEEQARSMSGARATAASGGVDSPQLDPVPQQLSAVIDARVIASVPELAL